MSFILLSEGDTEVGSLKKSFQVKTPHKNLNKNMFLKYDPPLIRWRK